MRQLSKTVDANLLPSRLLEGCRSLMTTSQRKVVMPLFKRLPSAEINADECEHILGVLITDRKQFINFSGIAQCNIYAGMVIGKAFNSSIEKLDDEFDALSIFYCWKVLNELGATEANFIQGANAVFDNCDINEEMRSYYSRRINEYSDLDTPGIGEMFLNNIASIYHGKLEKNDPAILTSQLNKFHKLLKINIRRELAA